MMSKKLTCHAKSRVNRNEVIENQFVGHTDLQYCDLTQIQSGSHAEDVKKHFACQFWLNYCKKGFTFLHTFLRTLSVRKNNFTKLVSHAEQNKITSSFVSLRLFW